jgi:primosomal protein N' (replication factor Y)
MSDGTSLYANVILPLKFRGTVTYMVPCHLHETAKPGARVKVNFSNRDYIAVISSLGRSADEYSGKIKEIISVEPLPGVSQQELSLWRWISDYYMCSEGEVYKAAYPGSMYQAGPTKEKSRSKAGDKAERELPLLSEAQNIAYNSIKKLFAADKTVFLNGVTGSGKTEMYIRLASEVLSKGRSVLYMVPEIALSNRLSNRLKEFFPDNLLVYHSGQGRRERGRIQTLLRKGDLPLLLLGTRSSIFLPFSNLSLIIVDQEHDPSYKQSDPSPRYNGRDSAIMLAKLSKADVILGSATPSLESLFNVLSGRYKMVELKERYHREEQTKIEVIDTIKEKKKGNMLGELSSYMVDQIKDTLLQGEQVMVFRNRRAYSSFVQCMYCGYIPFCSKCNVPMSYHKAKGELKCHYCDNTIKFNTICPECGKPGLKERGAGTEKIEESLKMLIPQARIGRLDLETAGSRSKEEKILKEFGQYNLDILVGTQMISKGFDFEKLSLVCVVQAESILALQDFRANERALQLIEQFSGMIGRKGKSGKLLIQSSRADDLFFRTLASVPPQERIMTLLYTLLKERKEFDYPPFVRLIKMTLKSKSKEKLEKVAEIITERSLLWKVKDFSGPYTPPVDMIRGEHLLQFWIKLGKGNLLLAAKKMIDKDIDEYVRKKAGSVKISVDVDPN